MSSFNFKDVLRENLYVRNYPHQDKIKIILNEGQSLMIEREIHEGIMDFLRGYTKEKPGWKKELGDQIDTWLNRSSVLNDKRKAQLKNYYMKNMSELPDAFYKDGQALADVEDSLEAAIEGDMDAVKDEMEDAVDDHAGGADEKGDTKDTSDIIDVPAFDMKIMDNILGDRLIKVVVNKFNKMGAALSQEEDQEMVKAFKGAFLPMIANMQKRAHIDIAEGMISEKTKRQLAYMKGQKRKKLGFQAYIKPRKGKESLFVQMLLKDLRKRLIDDVSEKVFMKSINRAINNIKDEKVRKQQWKRTHQNFERRFQVYKENAEEILNQIKKAADAAAAKALNISGRDAGGEAPAEGDGKSMSTSSLRAALSGNETDVVKLKRQIAKSMVDSGIKLPGGANLKSPVYDKIIDVISKVAKTAGTPGIKESKNNIYIESYNKVIEAIKTHENKK